MSRDRYAVVTAGGKRHVARWREDRCCPRHDAEGRWIPLCWQRAREWQETDGLADCSRCIREVFTCYAHSELAIARSEVARLKGFIEFLYSLVDRDAEIALEEAS